MMNTPLYIFDPTVSDKLGRVRGAGRYLQVLKSTFPDAIFTHKIDNIPYESTFINPFFEFLKPPLSRKRIAKKQVAVIHDLIPLKYPHKFPAGIRGTINIFTNKFTLGNYDAIITDSDTSKKDIQHILYVPEQNIVVAYPTLQELFFSPPPLLSSTQIRSAFHMNDTPYIMYVGDATWNKNLITMAQAVKEANVPCVVVGNIFTDSSKVRAHRTHPEQSEYIGFMDEIQHDKRFIKTGFIDDNILLSLYTHAAANILISRDEGFGYSFGEAAALHTPSILSDIPVLREISEGNALFADPQDYRSVAKAITSVMNDHFIRNEVGHAAYQSAQRFHVSRFKQSLTGLL
jgi:glycosyltransferase involved in cell wall biosynthesis